MLPALLFSLLLGVIIFWNEKIFFKQEANKFKTLSFIAGGSVAYVFLYILPDLYKGVAPGNQWLFIFILLGFSSIYLLEKYIFEHNKKEERLFKFKELHFFIFFIYYLIFGAVLAEFFEIGFEKGLLFFLPIMFYTAVSRFSFGEIHVHLRQQKIFRALLSIASFFGAIGAKALFNQITFYYIILAFITGAFSYVALVESLPREAHGKPKYFILGVGLYSLLVILNWVV